MSTLNQFRSSSICLTATFAAIIVATLATADPCGMVPPIYTGQSPIVRTGLQQTYVFHRDGVESFVIRPGYEGNTDNFGMLIPFPTPPSIRKIHDDIFEQIKNAVDPPEVVIDLSPVELFQMQAAGQEMDFDMANNGLELRRDEVRVLKEEAVGMYEVAVLAAGSAQALKKWMDENGYQFPEGMDDVANEYIEESWCFVAVKTKVSSKEAVDPRPGQREAQPDMPAGSVFQGHVQGLAFRFTTDELVVPMRLSAFNEGDLRNVVYLLTDGAKRIRNIPEEYVRRQLSGRQLVDNITKPVPLRIIGGTIEDIDADWMEQIKIQRDPVQYNGIAAQLFVNDVLASQMKKSEELLLSAENSEKSMVNISERLGLRGVEVDDLLVDAMTTRFEKDEAALELLRGMTLTLVDGDFPRDVLADQNLKFDDYRMAAQMNSPLKYDAKSHEPGTAQDGRLYLGELNLDKTESHASAEPETPRRSSNAATFSLLGAVFLIGFCLVNFTNKKQK